MSDWEPPSVGGTPDVAVTAIEPKLRWWKRRYRRVPVWGWAIAGLVGFSALSAAFAPPDDDRLATVDDRAASTSMVDAFAAVSSVASEPPTSTVPPPEQTVAPTIAATTTAVATTTDATTTTVTAAPVATTTPPTTAPPTTAAPTSAPPPTTAPAPSPASVEIAIRFDADGNDNQNKNDEWVRFGNGGTAALDMTGWVVQDEGPNHTYRFGTLVLLPGETVTLFTGCGTDEAFARFWCNGGSAVWNNSGDTVSLYDESGELIAQRSG